MTKLWSRSLSSIFLLFIFSLSFSQTIQSDKYVFINETPTHIIKTIEVDSDLKFNYIFDNLPKRTFTCTIDKVKELIINELSIIFNRPITKISEGVFAVGSHGLSDEELGNGEIVCEIFDSESKEPVIGATIRIPSVNYGVITDLEGVCYIEWTLR